MRHAGPLTMLLGYVSFGFAPVLLKLGLSHGWQAPGAIVVRFVVALVLTAAIALAGQAMGGAPVLTVRPVNKRGLVWRGIFGGASVLSYFYAIQLTGAGLGTLLNYTHSIWANVFGVMLGRHRPDRWFWPLLAVAGAGLWLIVDPRASDVSRGGLLVGVISGMAGGGAVLTIKTLRATDNALTINLALTIGGLVSALPLEAARVVSAGPPPLTLAPFLFLAASGVFSYFGQLFFNHGFRHTSVPLASLLSLLTPVLAALSGWLILGERLTSNFLLGASLILLACAMLGHRETQENEEA
jgi:drug/metabolite transporter (DMT)-like permease